MSTVPDSFASASVVHAGRQLRTPYTNVLTTQVEKRLVEGVQQIVVDLSDLADIDAAGIGTLVGVWNLATAINGRVRFVGAGRRVRRLLVIVGLHWMLDDRVR